MKPELRGGRQPPAVLRAPRRLRRPRSAETERIRGLLQRLQHIVPAAPKDRQLPQVQVIRHVIDYICQLQLQVVRHPRFAKQPPPQLPLVAPQLSKQAAVEEEEEGEQLASPGRTDAVDVDVQQQPAQQVAVTEVHTEVVRKAAL